MAYLKRIPKNFVIGRIAYQSTRNVKRISSESGEIFTCECRNEDLGVVFSMDELDYFSKEREDIAKKFGSMEVSIQNCKKCKKSYLVRESGDYDTLVYNEVIKI